MNVVYNNCYGGFGLSHEAVMLYAKLKGITLYTDPEQSVWGTCHYFTIPVEQYREFEAANDIKACNEGYFSPEHDISRDDPDLVKVVLQLGEKANGPSAELAICFVPDGVDYEIEEYDGKESVVGRKTYYS